MWYGIKISKKGIDVTKNAKTPSIMKTMPYKVSHILQLLALPYLQGAHTQLKRYKEATLILKDSPFSGSLLCLHEVSTLFEDLNTVAIYVKSCGYNNETHKLWKNIRDHIRHDYREEFDKENKHRKVERALFLKLDPNLQADIEFDNTFIRFGDTVIKVTEIERYLEWADGVITETLAKAKQEGYITN